MDTTPNLSLPYIAAAQAQKHVTHNEAIRALDALVQLAVLTRTLAAPPASPADGARYIVAAGASGAWAGHTGKIAAFQDGAWEVLGPREGFLAWVADEDKICAWDGSAWVAAGGGSINPAPLVGVNASADATNRLAVSSPASLFNHEGAGHQLKINKAAATNTAALLLQTAFSGRAEVGLAGDDNLRVKVSADGATWRDAIVVDRTSGAVTLPNTTLPGGSNAVQPSLIVNGDFQINQRAFAGGALAAGAYGHDRWKAAAGGASWSVAGLTVTLASGTLEQVVESAMWGYANLASTQVTVSLEAPSADLTVTFGSASGTITAGSGRRSLTLTTGAGDTGNLALRIAKASGSGVSFARVKLEVGASATGWQARALSDELVAARRYYQVFGSGGVGANRSVGTQHGMGFGFQAAMRTTPSITLSASAITAMPGINDLTITSIASVALATTTGCYLELVSAQTAPATVYVLLWKDTNKLAASAEL
jgi:hypothetical protein